jgi:transposase
MARRKYSDEYKKEAVALTKLPGATITGVAKDLGIYGHMLGRWRKQLEAHGDQP